MKNKNNPALRSRDTAMALSFLALLIFTFSQKITFLYLGMFVLFLAMILPKLFNPLSLLWFGLGDFLGNIMSKVILILTYFFFIAPVSLLKRNTWKRKFSSFKENNPLQEEDGPKVYQKEDMENPY